ncbi:MAG TPA: tyrosine-type recombinase/integrase [Gemmatimonadales bacterium]|nr:tyrosine-type recombinase/integrase [Gemmatimonadales bacterium]
MEPILYSEREMAGEKQVKRSTWGRGSIEQRDADKWVLRLSHRTDPTTGKRVREAHTFRGTRRAAEKHLAKLLEQKDAHGPSPSTAGGITLDAWVRRQITTGLSRKTGAKRSAYTQAGMLDLWDRFSTPQLRATPLRDVTTSLLKAHIADVQARPNNHAGENARPLAPRTVQIYFNIIRAALFAAVEDHILALNPASGIVVRGGSAISKTSLALSAEEMQKFLEHDPDDRLRALWWVSAYTGARPGEVLALRWQDWDKQAGMLRFARSLERGTRTFVPCKAGSERTVAVNPELKTALLAHQLRQNGERAKINEKCAPGESRWVDESLMFTNEIGAPLEHHNVSRAFKARLKAAKVRAVRWYDLRHSFGSALVKAGTDIKTVATLMGHKKVTMTLEHYVKSDAEQQTAAVAKLPWANAKK